jgi:hypothetical protein
LFNQKSFYCQYQSDIPKMGSLLRDKSAFLIFSLGGYLFAHSDFLIIFELTLTE